MPNDAMKVGTMPSPVIQAPTMLRGDDEIDLRQLFDLLRSGKWTIAAITVAAILLGTLYVLLIPPTYEADGLVQVEEDQKSGSASSLSDISSLLLGTPVQTEAEIQVLQSRMVLDQVIEKMNLLVSASPHAFPLIGRAFARWNRDAQSPIDPPLGLKRYAWGGEQIEVSTFEVPGNLLGKKFNLITTKSGFELEDPSGTKLVEGLVGTTVTAQGRDGPITIFVRELRARPDTRFDVTRYSLPDTFKKLTDALRVSEQGKQSGVIAIDFTGPSPEFVSEVVNNIENAYLRQNVERRSAEAQHSLDFLGKQLPELKNKVDAAQAGLKAYQLAHGSVDVTQETELLLKNSVDLETSRLQLIQQREDALQRFTPEHPAIKALDAQLKSIEGAQQKLKGQSDKLPTTQQEILSLTRDLDVASQLYTQMLNSVQELQVAKAGTVGNVRVVDYALQPIDPSAPKPKLVLALALLVGAFLGTGFVLVQRALLRGIDDPTEVENLLGLATYASIPYTSGQRQIGRQISRGQGGDHILASIAKNDLAVEALRSLRNSMHFLLLESSNNVVMLTGPAPGLGKSFVTINLGAVLALSGKRVVVVDADLRRGHLHKYASLDAGPGVSDYIVGDAAEQAVVRKTAVEGLMLVTRGTSPPNPAELLMHDKFATLVKHLSRGFDYVIIDTPPSLLVADAGIIGRLAGCTLLLLKSGEHPMREIEESYRRLTQVGVKVHGTVFNQVGRRLGSYGYGGYGYSYNKYYES